MWTWNVLMGLNRWAIKRNENMNKHELTRPWTKWIIKPKNHDREWHEANHNGQLAPRISMNPKSKSQPTGFQPKHRAPQETSQTMGLHLGFRSLVNAHKIKHKIPQ